MMNEQGKRVCRFYAGVALVALGIHLFGDVVYVVVGVPFLGCVLYDLYQQWTA